jgi:hypothetical protein
MTNPTPHITPLSRRAVAALAAAMLLIPATAHAKPADVTPAPQPSTQVTDVRTPDARDAGKTTVVVQSQDVRSPDARDAGKTTTVVSRVPDARDIALAQERSYSSYGSPKPIPVVHTATPATSDFDWPSAGIGAGALALIALLGVAGFMLVAGRRHGRSPALS